MPGTSVASVLEPQAASTPSVISENIPGRPARKPAVPPERIGQPPQNTIGVASTNCTQWPVRPVSPSFVNHAAIAWPPSPAGSM